MSQLFVGNYFQGFDGSGRPLSGGIVEFFKVGTSTPKDVYADAGLSTSLGNEVTLDSAGRAKIWLNGDYKARLKDSDGAVINTTDGINPDQTTETSNGNIIPNGSFDTAGNSSSDVQGWTITAQNDGTVERITSDNYEGDASLKFTSTGNGGGQADTDAFFAVSPGRSYEVSFALKCSVADIRNIVQVRYFDKDQVFLSNSTVYDEDTSNPTSWTLKTFSEKPTANARFAKLRILGADQSDATAGEAKFDSVAVRSYIGSSDRFPNVDGDVTATDEDLETISGNSSSGVVYPVIEYPPVSINSTAINVDQWVTISSGATSGAAAVRIRFWWAVPSLSETDEDITVALHARKTGSGDTVSNDNVIAYERNTGSNSSGGTGASISGEVVIPLDSNGDFDLYFEKVDVSGLGSTTSNALHVARIGYYV